MSVEVLAKFDIDDSLIISKIANNKKAILDLKNENKSYQTAYTAGLQTATKEIEKQTLVQKELFAKLSDGSLTQSAYNQLLSDSNNEILKNQNNIKSVTAEYQLNSRAMAINEEEIKALSIQNRGLSTSYQAIISQQNGLLENYTNEGKSIQQLREDNAQLTKIRNQLALATDGESAEIQKLNAQIDANTNIIKQNITEDEQRIANIGNYKSALQDGFQQVLNGDIKDGFNSIKESASGLFKTLFANPFLAIIAGTIAAGKAIFDYNDGIKESKILLENLGLDAILRPQIEGISKSFEISFSDIAGAVDQIMDLGLAKDQADALEQIKKGLITAPNADAFIATLESNSQAAKNLGLNLKDVIALQQTFEETGSSAEATFGALEKAQLNLTKTNQDVSDALSKTLGQSFSKELLSNVQNGTITYTDALNKINLKGKELKINSQEQADLQIALFGKSAIAAGGYSQILDNVSKSIDKKNAKLTDQQQATENLVTANQDLEKSLQGAFGIDSFGSMWDNFKAKVLSVISNLLNSFNAMKFFVSNLGNVFLSLRNKAVSAFQDILKSVSPFLSAIGIDVDKLQAKLNGLKVIIPPIKTTQKEEEKKKTEEPPVRPVAPVIDTKAIEEAKKKRDEAQKRLEENLKKELDLVKTLADDKIKITNAELQNYILNNASKLANEKIYTKALVDEEKKRLQDILDLKKKNNDNELSTKIANITAEITEAKSKQNILKGLEFQNSQSFIQTKVNEIALLKSEYYNKDLQLKQETEKSKSDVDNLFSNQLLENKKLKQALFYQQQIIDLETQGATESQIKNTQLDQQYEIEAQKYLEDIYNKFNLKIEADTENLSVQQEIDLAQEELENQIAIEKDANKLIALQNNLDQLTQLEQNKANKTKQIDEAVMTSKLQAYSKVFGDIGALFGKETVAAKIAGIAQASINTYLGATQALANPTLPFPLNVVSAGTVIASGLQSVAKIAGFADGGLVLNGESITRSNGDNVLITAKKGEVILNENQQALLGGASTFSSIGVPGFANGGLVASNIPNIQSQLTSTTNYEDMARVIGVAVMEGAMSGTAIGSQKGISDLNTTLKIEKNASF